MAYKALVLYSFTGLNTIYTVRPASRGQGAGTSQRHNIKVSIRNCGSILSRGQRRNIPYAQQSRALQALASRKAQQRDVDVGSKTASSAAEDRQLSKAAVGGGCTLWGIARGELGIGSHASAALRNRPNVARRWVLAKAKRTQRQPWCWGALAEPSN